MTQRKPASAPAKPPSPPPGPLPQASVCRRCGSAAPVGADGFCDKCEKALEQACL